MFSLSALDRRIDDALGIIRARISPEWVMPVAVVMGLPIVVKLGSGISINFFFTFLAMLAFLSAFMLGGLRGAILFSLAFSFIQPLIGRLIVQLEWLELGRSFDDFTVASDLFRTSVNLFLFLCLAFLFMRDFVDRKRIVETPLDIVILIFLAICCLQSLNPGQEIIAGIYGFRQEVGTVGLYFIGKELAKSESTLPLIFKAFLAYLVVNSIYGLTQHFGLLFPFDEVWLEMHKKFLGGISNLYVESSDGATIMDEKDMHLRPFGMSAFNMDLVFPVAGMCLFVFAYARNRKLGLLHPSYFVVLGALVMLAITKERTGVAMVFLGAVLGFIVFSKPRLHKSFFLGIFSFLAIWLPLFFLSPLMMLSGKPGLIRLAEIANPFAATTISGRFLHIYPFIFAKIIENPFGYGLGSGRLTRATMASGHFVLPHSEILQKAYELGVFGGISYAAIFITGFILARNVIKSHSPGTPAHLSASITLALFFAFGACAMVNLSFSNQSGLTFWTLFGIFGHYAAQSTRRTG